MKRFISINFCTQNRPQTLQNMTIGCYHRLQIKAKWKKLMTMMQ